jgi:hypothetical protein
MLASQDYHADRGLTPFMDEYFGVASVVEDARHTTVTGQAEPFEGLGPYVLDYPYTNHSDGLSPDATAVTSFLGSAGGAATSRDARHWRSTYLGFGLETLPAAADRQAVLGAFLDWCASLEEADGDGDGFANETDCAPGDPGVWAPPTAARDVRLDKAELDNVTWVAPSSPGAEQLAYDLLRSEDPVAFYTADCVASDLAGTTATDSSEPPPGLVYYYLVRARNECGQNLGTDSLAVPRQGAVCH